MTRALQLSFQLDEIDYTAPNFVHADLSGPELREHMAARDESLYTYFWRVIYTVIRETARDPLGMRDLQTILSSTAVTGRLSLKMMLAYEIARNQSLEEVFGDDYKEFVGKYAGEEYFIRPSSSISVSSSHLRRVDV